MYKTVQYTKLPCLLTFFLHTYRTRAAEVRAGNLRHYFMSGVGLFYSQKPTGRRSYDSSFYKCKLKVKTIGFFVV